MFGPGDMTEVGQHAGYPNQKGPFALGVFIGSLNAFALWLAYLRLHWNIDIILATLAILLSSVVVGLLAGSSSKRIRQRVMARKQREYRDVREAETQRQLAKVRKDGTI